MRHSLFILLAISALATLIACKPSVPQEIIQPGDMEDILYDYHVAQAMASEERSDNMNFERAKYFLAVLEKHGVTQADFDSSMVYYYGHLDRLKDIYLEVNERLSDEAKVLGASVGSIGRYSQYSAFGDTANIWNNRTDLLLIPYPTMNRFDFTVKVDTSFYKGDSFMFQFMSEYIWQSGSKEATVCIVTKYEGDSIIQTSNHISVSGISQIRVPANREQKLKEMYGFIYLSGGNNDETTRKLMFISQMQLIRFHNKELKNETSKDSLQTDSLQRGDDPRKPMPVPTGDRIEGRSSNQPVPIGNGDSQHRVDAGPVSIKEMR